MRAKMIVVAACLVFSSPLLFAQSDIARYFPAAAVNSGGAANVQALVLGFISPIADDFGSLSSSGWYHTAENHKKFGFDLTISMNAISANSASKYFTPPTLTSLTANGTTMGNDKFPTAYGPEREYPLIAFNTGPGTNNVGIFQGPEGGNVSKDVPIGSIAVPTIQGGLGLFGNTDLRFRFTPEYEIGGTTLSSLGFGLLHDIKQHIPGIKMAPFNLSLFVAYSQLKAVTDLGGEYYNASTGTSYAGQEGIGDTKGWTIQALVSKQLPVITFYGGIGYNTTTTTYKVAGTYFVNEYYTSLGRIPLVTPVTISNPFEKDFSLGSFRATGGIRLKFGPILLNGDYTYVNSKGMFSAGFGFTVH